VGFVLVGAAAVRCGWFADRRKVAAATGAALLVTLAMLADGLVPDRYPGDVHFVVPGLAVTIAVYALAQLRWGAVLAGLDRVVRRAAAHTLGIFLAHYALYAVLRRAGVLGDVPGGVAVPAAVVVTVVLCLVAPRVPLSWSLRTGRRPAGRRGQDRRS
jgi:peptidoglycan/LPS O-acetylase OafA/YrhL